MQKKHKDSKKSKELGLSKDADKNHNEFKSGKFFKTMSVVAETDKAKKEFRKQNKHGVSKSDPN